MDLTKFGDDNYAVYGFELTSGEIFLRVYNNIAKLFGYTSTFAAEEFLTKQVDSEKVIYYRQVPYFEMNEIWALAYTKEPKFENVMKKAQWDSLRRRSVAHVSDLTINEIRKERGLAPLE